MHLSWRLPAHCIPSGKPSGLQGPGEPVLLSCIFRPPHPALYTHRPNHIPVPPLPYPFPSCIYKIRKRTSLIGFSASCILDSGSVLSSQLVSKRVLSALKGLTSVFGMGTGGSPSLWPPEMGDRFSLFFFRTLTTA